MDTNLTDGAKKAFAHDLRQFGSMDVEAYGEGGELIFTGALKAGDNNSAVFENIYEPNPVPKDRVLAELRGFSPAKKKTVHMRGTLVKNGNAWSSKDLEVVKVVGDRTFFRMQINAMGTLKNDAGGASCPCRVKDISNAGARITSWGKHAAGDVLSLTADIDGNKTEMKCRVIRASGKGPYTYNCSFINVDDNTRRKLTKDILNAQFVKPGK